MATNRTAGLLVNEEFILENTVYIPRGGGLNATRYEPREGTIVKLRKVTPELGKKYNECALSEEASAGMDSIEQKNASFDVLIERCQTLTEYPESFDWTECSTPVLWRIVEDFLFLNAPRTNRREKS